MRHQILCPECRNAHFEVVLIEHSRLVLHCVMCSREQHVTTTAVRLTVS